MTSLLPAVIPLLRYSSGKPLSRPIGVRVCPVAQFNFFSIAFDPHEWTMVVFWKETSGRQPTLSTPENERGYDSNYPSPPNVTFFDDPDRQVRLVYRQDGLQLPSPASGRERVETGNTSRERLHPHPRPSPPEPQLTPIPMSDGEDDDMISHHKKKGKQRSRSRERVYPHVPVPQKPKIQPMVTPESDDDLSDADCFDC